MVSILPYRLTGAQVRIRGKHILGPLDLDLAATGTSMVLGPNGAGKTTLLRLIHGLQRRSGGSERWACGRQQALRAQAFVFQQPVLMRRSVVANIAYPLRLRGLDRREALARAGAQAETCGLAGKLAQPANSLSGGERQKLALARALVTGPQLLLCDEPTAHLDGPATREVEAILSAAARAGTRIVMATHDLGQARRLGSEVLLVHRGKIVEHAPASAFFDTPPTPEGRAFLNGDIL